MSVGAWLYGRPFSTLPSTNVGAWQYGAPVQGIGVTGGGAVIRTGVATGAGVATDNVIGRTAGLTIGVATGAGVGGGTFNSAYAIPALPTAIEITEMPFSDSRTEAGAGSQWYKFTADVAQVISVTVTGSTGNVQTKIADPYDLLSRATATIDHASNVHLLAGATAYFWWNWAAAGTFTVSMQAILADLPVPVGSIIINDDTATFFASVLDPATGDIITFLTNIPAGEMGATIPGYTIVADEYQRTGLAESDYVYRIYDSQTWEEIGIADVGDSRYPIATNSSDSFYTLRYAGSSTYYVTRIRIENDAVVVTPDLFSFTSIYTPSGLAVSVDGSKLYYTVRGSWQTPQDIRVFDITTQEELDPLITFNPPTGGHIQLTVTPNNHPGDLLIYPDGSLVTWYETLDAEGEQQYTIVRVSATGTLISSYAFTGDTDIDHLAPVPDNPNQVYAWLYNGLGGAIATINLSPGPGSLISLFEFAMAGAGSIFSPTEPFGVSSCCFMTSTLDSTPPTPPPSSIPEDTTTPCCSSGKEPNGTTSVPPDLDIIPGNIIYCVGTGLGPDGVNPPVGEIWI